MPLNHAPGTGRNAAVTVEQCSTVGRQFRLDQLNDGMDIAIRE